MYINFEMVLLSLSLSLCTYVHARTHIAPYDSRASAKLQSTNCKTTLCLGHNHRNRLQFYYRQWSSPIKNPSFLSLSRKNRIAWRFAMFSQSLSAAVSSSRS